ncbi:MAG: hypothetical protein KME49_14000 [Brasilonema octagenarum HA4186-MV1]|jgi:hypothetical protein|uniref:Uncharacterized protein n=1 Tax=Brasilonema octagenarum UFV-OR1 TaxID=417115 RepID=A0ABX1M4E4_9CYAN|nr:hypothetical protein [Brasilonema octagenarum]MBW4626575.1 hypothetical protein [Brasilonema octagenarum HA4186-MV1]NMF62055.1 hypothetical protein [Brasilonema octagenarum UFV-OR1]
MPLANAPLEGFGALCYAITHPTNTTDTTVIMDLTAQLKLFRQDAYDDLCKPAATFELIF